LPLLTPPKQMLLPKAPFCAVPCPGQNTLQLPVPAPVQQAFGTPEPVHRLMSNGLERLAVPVVSGLRLIGMLPMNDAHRPPGQSPLVLQTMLLFVPRKQRWPPAPATAAGAGQSLETPVEFLDWHAAPWFGLPSHTPVHGDASVPLHAAPPTETAQIGHGWAGLPVSTVAELSWNVQLAAPVDVLRVPVGPAHVPVPTPVQQANGVPAPVQLVGG
jgi:hypothetical protein